MWSKLLLKGNVLHITSYCELNVVKFLYSIFLQDYFSPPCVCDNVQNKKVASFDNKTYSGSLDLKTVKVKKKQNKKQDSFNSNLTKVHFRVSSSFILRHIQHSTLGLEHKTQ